MIRYRRPGLDDPVILQLIETQLVPLSTLSPMELDSIRKEMPARLRRGVTLIASNGAEDAPVGFIHFMMHGELVYIDMLAVAPAVQRKRWGASLMAQAEVFARSRGCTRAKVMVDSSNKKGLLFYRKLGYNTLRFITTNHCFEMEKLLL
ncbi:GNAT family N-acetyltransferase [Paenibacillus lemnae]|uniref:GNAT family N-acetyltransferase n=1 Tax=Paenibacillus lemnae TaxID=1330551 RepID=A0A848M649_PAELE|nr:GNAT family N-acetyltransferase [Paenibacillus lemnae]NMO96086.1 GNAT family N-acetyltransferase [Paenibacillus lemnae]